MPEAASNITFPFVVAAGITTTNCVADWLTKVVTGVTTPLKITFFTRSISVPVIVRLV